MSFNNEILAKTSQYITSLFADQLPSWAVYHNIQHTQEIVDAVQEIGEAESLNRIEMEVALLAAWFHDSGYTQAVDGHEEKSVEIATEFLKNHNYPQDRLERIVSAIRATKVPQQPKDLLEQVLCDADMIHLGKKRFFDRSKLFRTEIELRQGETMSDVEWLKKNVAFASKGNFFTTYALKEFTGRRAKNLIELQTQLREAIALSGRENSKDQVKKEREELKLAKEKRPERGIETMFRVVPKNHLDLSALADQKASILISTSSIILSIIFGLLVTKIDTHPFILVPTCILTLVCLTTMVFAILATRPNITTGTFTRDDVRQRKTNLLFFGNFHSSSLEDFDWGMREMMSDADYLYGSMIKDLYFLGKVLGVKYRYLRIAYTIFMWGLIVSVLAFGIAIFTAPAPAPIPAQ